jgi:hypothetical protein
MACMDYVDTVHIVDSAEPLASNLEPLPPQRSRLSLLGGRHPPGGGLLDGRGCGCLLQTLEPRRLGTVFNRLSLGGGASLPTYTVFEAVDLRWLQMVGYVPALIGIVGFPTAVGIAITRYRLYDIDILINRTLVFGTLTATLIALYFVGIVVLQRLFVVTTGERSTLAVVASTLVIAALFNPLRRRIQSFIDRRFYRRKYDARKTLETFSAQLRDETDLEALSDDLVGVVRETMHPAHVSLWLCPYQEAKGGRGEDPQPRD